MKSNKISELEVSYIAVYSKQNNDKNCVESIRDAIDNILREKQARFRTGVSYFDHICTLR